MDLLKVLYDKLPELLPVLAAVVAAVVALWLADWLLLRRNAEHGDGRVGRQVAMLLLTAAAILVVVVALPVSDTTRGQLLSLVGVVLTAVIALASTTFVSNAMAGLMLRAVRSFRPGDFVRVGGQFGRITERGLFHTEIQTEDRDLTTLPNMFLVSNPVTVVRSSGTVVSCRLTLGYDEPHGKVEPILVEATGAAGLRDGFVQIVELGDYAVTYRVAGFLPEVKQLLSVRSTLRGCVLDALHGAGIEIVSPAFMNQRRISAQEAVIPGDAAFAAASAAGVTAAPEDMIFDKAERAERREAMKAQRDRIDAEIREIEKQLAGADDDRRITLKKQIDGLRRQAESLAQTLQRISDDDPD